MSSTAGASSVRYCGALPTEDIETLVLDQVDPRERGRAHGEHWRAAIRECAEIRLERCARHFADVEETLEVARWHVPVLAAHLPALAAELEGIAEGAGVDVPRIVVLNHYTDLRDVPGPSGARAKSAAPEGCTAIYCPGHDDPVLAQTWDMHAAVAPYVRALRIVAGDGSEIVALTLTGCLGMCGAASRGVAVTINNLSSTDGRVGVLWPAIVRTMLAQDSARAAYEQLRLLPRSSGHHYMIADGSEFFGVETSGELTVLTQVGAHSAHVHTNHCFDPVLRKREAVDRSSTTWHRLDLATTLYAQQRPTTLDHVWSLLHAHGPSAGALCRHADPEDPEATATCAIWAVRLRDGVLRMVAGCAERSQPIEVRLRARGDA